MGLRGNSRASEAGTKARAQQGQFHRIAGTLLASAFKQGAITKHRDFQEKEKLLVVGELSSYRFFAAIDLDFAAGHPKTPHSHAIFGQGAGLVRKDDSSRAERLDCREALDQRILTSHAPHTAG